MTDQLRRIQSIAEKRSADPIGYTTEFLLDQILRSIPTSDHIDDHFLVTCDLCESDDINQLAIARVEALAIINNTSITAIATDRRSVCFAVKPMKTLEDQYLPFSVKYLRQLCRIAQTLTVYEPMSIPEDRRRIELSAYGDALNMAGITTWSIIGDKIILQKPVRTELFEHTISMFRKQLKSTPKGYERKLNKIADLLYPGYRAEDSDAEYDSGDDDVVTTGRY